MLFENIYKPTGNQVLQGELAEHRLHVYFSKSEITKFSKVTEKQSFSLICFLVMWKLTPNWQLPSEGKTPSYQNSPCFVSGQDLIEKNQSKLFIFFFFLFPFSYPPSCVLLYMWLSGEGQSLPSCPKLSTAEPWLLCCNFFCSGLFEIGAFPSMPFFSGDVLHSR